jgi:hypothetical protein
MLYRLRAERVFRRGSNVRKYWLAHCEGFTTARGGGRGRVAGVVLDPRNGRAHSVIVRSATAPRGRAVPAERVAAVDPFARVLYVDGRSVSLASRVEAGARTAHAAAVAAGKRTRELAVWLRPRVQTCARAAAAGTALTARRARDGAVWVEPRLAATARAGMAGAQTLANMLFDACASSACRLAAAASEQWARERRRPRWQRLRRRRG